ncbi:MAG: hypothetical protein WAT39_01940 [Planctomycetota bacterium]
MPDLRLPRDHEADLVVTDAQMIAEVSSREQGADRWTELRVWRSGAGLFVAEQVGRTIVDGERDRCRAWVCQDHAEVVHRLRRKWLALKLYRAAGIDASERIE